MGQAESLANAKVDLEERVLKGRGEAGSKACLLLTFTWWKQQQKKGHPASNCRENILEGEAATRENEL